MAFTVEDGTGVIGANAYIAMAFATTYHADRANAAWAAEADNTVKQAAIIRASEYIDKRFGRRFLGYRQTKSQGLEWPRLSAIDADDYLLNDLDDVPRQLQKACAEYALRALTLNPLAPDPALAFTTRDTTGAGESQSDTAQGGVITGKREKVGPIEEETKYESMAASIKDANIVSGSTLLPGFLIPPYPEADMWIEELLQPSGSRQLVRG